MRRILSSAAILPLVLVVACSAPPSKDSGTSNELAAQTPQAAPVAPIDSEVIRTQEQRVIVQQFIAKHDSLGKLPGWYTTSGGGRHICDVEGHFRAAENIGSLKPGIAGTDLGGVFEESRREAKLEFVSAVFRNGFVGCPNDGPPEPWFIYLDRARDSMLADSLTPENAGLTVEQMDKFLLEAAKRAVKDYKLAEYIKNEGGGESWPEPYLVDIFARKYQFTAEQLGLNKADLDKYLNHR